MQVYNSQLQMLILQQCIFITFKVAEHSFCMRFADSVSDALKRALGLWYANTAVDKVIPQFHMNWIIKLSFDLK